MNLDEKLSTHIFSFLTIEEKIKGNCFDKVNDQVNAINGMYYSVKHNNYTLLSYFESKTQTWLKTLCDFENVLDYATAELKLVMYNRIFGGELYETIDSLDSLEKDLLKGNLHYKSVLLTLLYLASSLDRVDMCEFLIQKGVRIDMMIFNYAVGKSALFLEDVLRKGSNVRIYI